MTRRWQRGGRHPRGDDAGFVLLVAFLGALMLLLSSLSIQTAALQSRASDLSLRRRHQRDDLLNSAAQLVAGGLQHHPCLLGMSKDHWDTQGRSCSDAADLMALSSGTLPADDTDLGRYEITSYEPVRDQSEARPLLGGNLQLAWVPARGSKVQRRFYLELGVFPDANGAEVAYLRGVRP